MSGAEVPLIIAGTGAAISVYGQISGAQAQKDAAEKDAAFKHTQASELLSRQAINEQTIREHSEYTEKNYAAAFSGTGREGGGIGGIMQIQKTTLENIANSRRDTEFKASMLRAGADVELQLASDNMTASYITGAGSLIGSSAKVYSDFKGPSKSKGFS